MAGRGVPGIPRGQGVSGPSVLLPAAWEAWGRARADTGVDRVTDEPEHPIALAGAAHEGASTRSVILDTAERLFADRGFAAVTMRRIALDAGLKNQASLYHHFRDKRALYEAVLARGLEPIVAVLVESSRGAPAPDADAAVQRRAIDESLDRLLDYLTERPHLPRLIQRAALDDSPHVRNALSQLLAPLYEVGLAALAGAGRRWEARDLPHVAFGIYHLIFGYFANVSLLEVLLPGDPRGAEGAARQRRFVKAAVAQLLGVAPAD